MNHARHQNELIFILKQTSACKFLLVTCACTCVSTRRPLRGQEARPLQSRCAQLAPVFKFLIILSNKGDQVFLETWPILGLGQKRGSVCPNHCGTRE